LKQVFHSNGKLLITGEYVVLDGATAMAVPTRFGQTLEVEIHDESIIHWKSYDHKDNIWYEEQFSIIEDLKPLLLQSPSVTDTLLQLLRTVTSLQPGFPGEGKGYSVITKLEFPSNWGLGSSSTLINNIAQWTHTNPMNLLMKSFGGSGYDVAAAQMNSPFLYTLNNGPVIQALDLRWDFMDRLFFVHLNEKQNSREAIDHYHSVKDSSPHIIRDINAITHEISECRSIETFRELIDSHEEIISSLIGRATVKEILFKEYSGSVKSLGAWGGDFVLVTVSDTGELDYFRNKGYPTIIAFKDMVK
jgi:mevalonate kinase